MVKLLCSAISSPRSQVSERRNATGSCRTCWLRAPTTVAVSLPGTFTSMQKREWHDLRLPQVVRGWKWHRRSCLGSVRARWRAVSGGSAAATADAELAPVSALRVLVRIDCDRSFRATRAGFHPWDTAASAIRKFVAATNPGSVYSQRSVAACGWWLAGTAWAAGRMPRPADRPRWLDTEVARHGGRPPDSPSTRRVADAGQ